jgi:hypothetical protein
MFLKNISPDRFMPTYYPNPSDLTMFSNGPEVDSLSACRDWINSEALRNSQNAGEYDYECGLNCNFDDKFDIFVCEDTLR